MHYFAKVSSKRLNATFQKAVKTGVTRFEFTVYTHQLPNFSDVMRFQTSQLE